jgi:hypothetical protein
MENVRQGLWWDISSTTLRASLTLTLSNDAAFVLISVLTIFVCLSSQRWFTFLTSVDRFCGRASLEANSIHNLLLPIDSKE